MTFCDEVAGWERYADKRGRTIEKGESIMSKLIDLPGKQQRGWTGWNWSLWYRWILANAVGEGVGLGRTLTMGFVLFAGAEKTLGPVAVAGLAILAGTGIEGTVVGTAQWSVLRHPLPKLSWHTWALVTALGAFVAWALGMTVVFIGMHAVLRDGFHPGMLVLLLLFLLGAGGVVGAVHGLALVWLVQSPRPVQ